MEVTAVLLAAGKSSRFWPLSKERHKSTIKVFGKPIILWTIESLMNAGIRKFVIVQSPSKDVEKCLESYEINADVKFVTQEKPLGMGDAVEKARECVDDYFLVLNPNHFDAEEFVKPMIDEVKKGCYDAVFLGKETSEPWNYGVFVFKDGKPVGIVEKPEKGKEPSNVRIMGIYLLSSKFFDYHSKVELHEYSFEDALSLLLKNENCKVCMTEKSTVSLKYPWHLLDFTLSLLERKIEKGYISENACVSERACIEGKVYVEEGARVFENAVVKGPCYIGRNAIVGNNAVVRSSHIGDASVVGANCEVARSVFLDDVHVHSGYVGDSVLAEGVRVGAGTVFANVRLDRGEIYAIVKGKRVSTGRKKLGAVVGNGTKIGINCSIMPGTLIGSNCIVYPASVVKGRVEDNSVVGSCPI